LTDKTDLSPESLANTHVFADQFWLVQVLQNILDNAIYFAKNTVAIQLYSHAHTLNIDIFNDGKLLPDYAVDKAFDRYFSLSHQSQAATHSDESSKVATPQAQPHTTSNTLKKGTGLGLTLVKQVIEHHGGQVAINNVNSNEDAKNDKANAAKHPHSGVMVSITLPLAKA